MRPFFVLFVLLVFSFFSACDMERINDLSFKDLSRAGFGAEGGISEDEMIALEREGHYLKLVNMPLNTQSAHVSSCFVFNSASSIARIDQTEGVKIFKSANKSTVYISLIYLQGGEFIEDGLFHISLNVYIDALTWINIVRGMVIVEFNEGRGTLDVLSLPQGSVSPQFPTPPPPPGSGVEDEIERLIENGSYLKLYHLPSGALKENISGVSISDGERQAAYPDPGTQILIGQDGSYTNAYIPLATQSGHFTRTGNFIVSLNVRIDALTRIFVPQNANIIVSFDSGRGTLDIEHLLRDNPELAESAEDPETEEEIEDIVQGGYIRFYNAPRNISKLSFRSISVHGLQGVVARPVDYESIAVRKNVLDAEAFISIAGVRAEAAFNETGSFYISYTISIDALTQIMVLPSYALLYSFTDGQSEVDVSLSPIAPALPPYVPHSLSIGGLPHTAGAPNVTEVLIYNSAGIVAKCIDYTQISIMSFDGHNMAVVPLVYDNNGSFNGMEFAESGNFIVSFTIFPDATQVIKVVPENRCFVVFQNGFGFLDVSNIPPVPRKCLTITNLPLNIQEPDVGDVFVWNQTGKIAKCQGYDILEITREGGAATLKIPLVFNSNDSVLFSETGPYYVSFDLNIDALTRLLVVQSDNLVVFFTLGEGTLDAANIPAALPVPYFTIMGLPRNTARGNFSEVFLYNAAGKIAKCADYSSIIVTRNESTATAMIPLVYNSANIYFRDSGSFVVSFIIHVDINTSIIKERADSLVVDFTDGSGELNLLSDKGYFQGELLNPSDTAAPVLKSGMIFEMNGGYEKLTANTAVQNASFTSTRIVYIYAIKNAGNLSFVYSDVTPVFDEEKGGFYNGTSRALYKMVYVLDSVINYAGKKIIHAEWGRFEKCVISNVALSNIENKRVLTRTGNGAAQTYNTGTGWYVFTLQGAGGGGGGGIDGVEDRNRWGGNGGAGGRIVELVYIKESQPLILFSGGGGGGSGYIGYGKYQGAGAGGGGSGAFVYSAQGYFLCAGGGGGGGGGGASDGAGGGGGAGGATGSGGGGGKGGDDKEGLTWYYGSNGGAGGGYAGGRAGDGSNYNGGNGGYALFASAWGYNGWSTAGDQNGEWGGYGGSAAHASYQAPDNWKNTNGANGTGGYGSKDTHGGAGAAGGNNRNSIRGGGAGGGGAGAPSDGGGSAGGTGGAGYVHVYKLD